MSIEALYAVSFGHAGVPNHPINGGVVVFETNRLFGGDSLYAYTGNYILAGNTVSGNIYVIRHNFQPGTYNAWGTQENEFDVQFTASVNEDYKLATGTMTKAGMSLDLALNRVTELP